MLLKNEKGIVLIASLLILCLMTIIGVALINTSSIESIISGVEKERTGSFFASEGGIQHLKGNLTNIFVERNSSKIAAGQTADWDFALNGSEPGVIAATDTNYEGGAVWISDGSFSSGYTYNVRIWNNDDDGNATNDTDGIIYMRSNGNAPRGGNISIEITLYGGATGGAALTGYTAQAGAGAGKNYNADDKEKITDFTEQINM